MTLEQEILEAVRALSADKRRELLDAKYEQVRRIKLGFGYIPAQSAPHATVEDLKALREVPAALADPVIHTGDGTLAVSGSVSTWQYLEYRGGDTAVVYDENWNKVRELTVAKTQYTPCPQAALPYRSPRPARDRGRGLRPSL